MKIQIDTGRVPATEDEASRCWCPFARVMQPGQQSGNRIGTFMKEIAARARANGNERDAQHFDDQERDSNCRASRCMAWRWADYNKRGDNDEATGFCGLAGKPEVTT
jgi:hypothetical protein